MSEMSEEDLKRKLDQALDDIAELHAEIEIIHSVHAKDIWRMRQDKIKELTYDEKKDLQEKYRKELDGYVAESLASMDRLKSENRSLLKITRDLMEQLDIKRYVYCKETRMNGDEWECAVVLDYSKKQEGE